MNINLNLIRMNFFKKFNRLYYSNGIYQFIFTFLIKLIKSLLIFLPYNPFLHLLMNYLITFIE